jgi:hypothetical protein
MGEWITENTKIPGDKSLVIKENHGKGGQNRHPQDQVDSPECHHGGFPIEANYWPVVKVKSIISNSMTRSRSAAKCREQLPPLKSDKKKKLEARTQACSGEEPDFNL